MGQGVQVNSFTGRGKSQMSFTLAPNGSNLGKMAFVKGFVLNDNSNVMGVNHNKSKLCLSGFKSVPGKFLVLSGWFCVLVTSDKKQDGSRTAYFYAFPICGDSFISCFQSVFYPMFCKYTHNLYVKTIDMRIKKAYNT